MKNILITGAASGIGFGIAQAFAQKKYHVLLSDVNLPAATKAVERLREEGGEATPLELDVTQDKHVKNLLESIGDKPVDVLINNAGLQHVANIENFPIEKWDFLIQVMLTGVARLTQAVLPKMKQQNFGRIINIGSIHSLVASPYKSAYVAAKHGLLGFSKVVALETADKDITMNTVCPAYVKTPLVEQQIASQAKEHGISEEEVVKEIMLKPMPKAQFITIEELSETCAFLASDFAKNITGQTLVLDGGWTAR
ncbi:MAG: 3-hydroxybutyrate dehydrogenase [Pseudomonadota bacterium]